MNPEEIYRRHVLDLLVRDIPSAFWQGYQDRARSLYRDAFSDVLADPRLNPSQRLSKLWQERHYAMEWLLIDEAKQNGLPASDKLIVENNCTFALAGTARMKMTQKYVRQHGGMPAPTKFLKQLAAVNSFYMQCGFLLGDEPDDLYLPPEINGIVLHSPAGSRFVEEHQSLGAIGFYVPYKDLRGWAVQLTFVEILSAYETKVAREDRVLPVLRKSQKRGTDE